MEYKRLSRFFFQRRLKSKSVLEVQYVSEQRNEVGLPSLMAFNGETACTQQGICNLFSAKFTSVFEDEHLPASVIFTAANNKPAANYTLGSVDLDEETILGAEHFGSRHSSSPDLMMFLRFV